MSKLSTDMGVCVFALEDTYAVDAIEALYTTDGDVLYQKVGAAADLVPSFEPFRFDILKAVCGGVPFTPKLAGGTYNIPMPLLEGVGADFTPEYSPMLEIAGMQKTVNAGVSTVYTSGCDYKSATIYRYWRDSQSPNYRLRTAVGCQGSFLLEGVASEPCIFTPSGISTSYPKLSANADFFLINSDGTPGNPNLLKDLTVIAPAYAGVAAPVVGSEMICIAQSLSVDGTVFPVSAWSLDQATTAAAVPVVQAEDGVGCVALASTNQTGNLALEACDGEIGLDLALGLYTEGSIVELIIILRNDVSQITIQCPTIQLLVPAIRDQNTQAAWDIAFEVSGSYTITYEALVP